MNTVHAEQPGPRSDWRGRRAATIVVALGLGVSLGLGLARGTVQGAVQHSAHRFALTGAFIAASAMWLPVPWIIGRVLLADIKARTRWILLGAWAAIVCAVEPLWFVGALEAVSVWRSRGGYAANAALRLDSNLLIFAAIAGWLWLRELQRRRLAAAERVADLLARTSAAEMGVLTMQLQPHFLFNTLNLVSQLAFENAARARSAIANLGRLLEKSVGTGGRTITLADEVTLLESYLDLQRDRFRERLDAIVIIDSQVRDARVPPMLLQPLVENAIRHGISLRKEGGCVRVHAQRSSPGRLRIEVEDDGIGLRAANQREGLGLTNARHRLEELHPHRTRLELRERPGGGAVTRVELPLETDEPPSGTAVTDDDATRAWEADELATIRATRPRWFSAAAIVVGWSIVAAIWTELEAMPAMNGVIQVEWRRLFETNMLIAVAWMMLTPLVLWLSESLVSRSLARRIASHCVGAFIFTGAHLFLGGVLMRLILHSDATEIGTFRMSWLVWDVIAYILLVAIGEITRTRASLREDAITSASARGRLALARVAMMRLQLQPSLFRSSLVAIDALVDDPDRCETALTRLGDLLRLLIANAGTEETRLRDELAMLEAYTSVIGQRSSSHILDVRALESLVPTVLLCPLARALGGSTLRIVVGRTDDTLSIEVASKGVEFDPALLVATQNRLAELFPQREPMRLMRQDDEMAIVLDLPYRTDDRAVTHGASENRAIA